MREPVDLAVTAFGCTVWYTCVAGGRLLGV